MKNLRTSLFVLMTFALVLGLAWVGCQNGQQINNSDTTLDLRATNPMAVQKVMTIQDANTPGLMALPGVVGTGTGIDENGNLCIKVFTAASKLGTNPAPKMASSIEGIPVVTEETGEFRAFALTGTYRPVPIGVSIGNDNECAAGTLGCVVIKNGVKYILSNNHVLARQNAAKIGEKIDQPGRYDKNCGSSGQIATLSDFVPISFSGTNTMDAAIAQFTSGISVSCATPSAYYGYPGSTVVSPSLNLAIQKVGRTSSKTTGKIAAINVTVTVGYDNGNATFTGQFQTAKGFSKSGDSGSLIVTNNTSKNPVGLLFAGTSTGVTIGNPIGPVLSRFGVTICTQ